MNTEALKAAIDSLNIIDVCLREANLKISPGYYPNSVQGQFPAQFRWGTKEFAFREISNLNSAEKAIKLLSVHVGAGFRILDPQAKDAKDPIPSEMIKAEVEATFLAEYRVISEQDIPVDGLAEFVKHNSVYHIWPYWRELLQSACARARLGNIVVPMLVLRGKAPELAMSDGQQETANISTV